MNGTVRATPEAAMYRWHLEERRYVYVSPEIAGMTGFLAEDLEEMGRDQFMARVHPEDRRRVEAEAEAVLHGGRATLFYRFLRRDGTYCTLMEHLYVATESERRVFLDGVLRDVTDQLSVGPWRGDSLGAEEAIGVLGRVSVKGKVAAGIGLVAVLVLVFGTGYLTGLRQGASSRAGTALPASLPGGAQVTSPASDPGAAASPSRKKVTKRARLSEARAASAPRHNRIVRNRETAAPLPRTDVAASQPAAVVAPPAPSEPSEEVATPSFWSRLSQLPPQRAVPDPPSFR